MALDDTFQPEKGYPMVDDVLRKLTSLRRRHGNVRVMLECDWSSIKEIAFVPAGEHAILKGEDDMIVLDSDTIPF